jgi:hypothetical protein
VRWRDGDEAMGARTINGTSLSDSINDLIGTVTRTVHDPWSSMRRGYQWRNRSVERTTDSVSIVANQATWQKTVVARKTTRNHSNCARLKKEERTTPREQEGRNDFALPKRISNLRRRSQKKPRHKASGQQDGHHCAPAKKSYPSKRSTRSVKRSKGSVRSKEAARKGLIGSSTP